MLNEWVTQYIIMKIVEHLKWDSQEIECLQVSPKCFFCEILTEPTIIYHGEDKMIRGWKCSCCGLMVPHSNDIRTAISVLKR